MRVVVLALTAIVLVLAGCRSQQAAALQRPPERVAPGFTFDGGGSLPLHQAPAEIRALGPLEWAQYRYSAGAGSVEVAAYRMPSAASAFEARQKWRSERGRVSFDRGDLFVVCSSTSEPLARLLLFSRNLENAWVKPAQ